MIGDSILHYRVLAKIGEGGMGIVYSALDARLGRTVALKILQPDKSNDPKRRQRFLREARAAAALNHPNIVGVYDIGQEHGVDFIAMEFVPGHSLQQLMKQAQLPIPDILSYSSQIAGALAKAHAAGVVHRDLKPGNVMITDEGSVKLLDFGLAQLNPVLAVADTGLEAETESAITQLGVAVGTIQYMSPEQGRGETVDERSDIFSFGVMLYEMLAGVRPFHASSTIALLHAIGYDQPKPVKDLRQDIPPNLQEIVSRCLQKQPAARYAGFEPIAATLRNMAGTANASIASGAPVEHPAPAKRGWKRFGWAAPALVAVIVLGLSAVALSSWYALRDGAFGSAIHLPAGAAEWNRRGHAYLFRYDKAGNVDHAIESFQHALEQDHDNAAAYAGLGESYAQQYAENHDSQWLRLAQANAGRALQLNDLLAEAHVSMGIAKMRATQFNDGERELRRAIELDPNNAGAHLRLAESLALQNRPKDAEAAYRQAIGMHRDDWRPHHFLGALYYSNGRYEDAIASFERAAKLAPDNAAIYRLLGGAYHMLDRDPEAAEALQKALAIRQTPAVLTNLGTIYYYEGRYLDAVKVFQRGISNGANDFYIWGNLGDAYRYTPGNQSKAIEAYQQGTRLVEQQLVANPDDPVLRSSLAQFLAKAGAKNRALEEIRRAQSLPKLDPASLRRLGIASELSGKRENALELLSKAVQAGFGIKDIQNDPDLIALRKDPGYHRMVLGQVTPERK